MDDQVGVALDAVDSSPYRDNAIARWSSSPETTAVHHTVRPPTHRYTLRGNSEEELYDHQANPHEWHNQAADPRRAVVRAALRRELAVLLTRDQTL